jgi:hypothetical protein
MIKAHFFDALFRVAELSTDIGASSPPEVNAVSQGNGWTGIRLLNVGRLAQ